MRNFLLSTLFFLAAQLCLAQNAEPSYIWTAERKIVVKDGIRYRYVKVDTQKIDGMPEGNREFAESWARACQDSILLSRDKVTAVANRFYKRYIDALGKAEATGVYDYPVKDYADFDITAVRFDYLKNGTEFGVGAAFIVPMGDMSNMVGPIVGVSAEGGTLLGKGYLCADITAGIGKDNNNMLYLSGKDEGSIIPYYSIAGTYKYHAFEVGKDRCFLIAGAGYANAIVSYDAHTNLTESNKLIGGIIYTAGVSYDYKLSDSFSFIRGKHKKQDTFLRVCLYAEHICTLKDRVITPMPRLSISFVTIDRKVKIKK